MTLKVTRAEFLGIDRMDEDELRDNVLDLLAENARLRRGTTTRHAKYRTKYGRRVPLCECCSYSIGDMRWHFCPNCGAEVVDE